MAPYSVRDVRNLTKLGQRRYTPGPKPMSLVANTSRDPSCSELLVPYCELTIKAAIDGACTTRGGGRNV